MTKSQDIKLKIAKIKNLPPLPEAGIKIIAAVNDPDISVEDLVDAISLSPALLARLLGLANSAYFGRTGQIKDLRVAIIQVLGTNLVRSLALSIVLNVELDTTKCKLFDTDLFWNHALLTALVAQKLSVHCGDELMSPCVVYTSGLLLEIGLLAAVYIIPEQMNEIFAELQEGDILSEQMKAELGQTQYDLGGELLERWHLPEIYQIVLNKFHQPDFAGEERKLIILLELSKKIGAYLFANQEEMPDFSDLFHPLSLSQEQVSKVITDVNNKKDDIKELATFLGG